MIIFKKNEELENYGFKVHPTTPWYCLIFLIPLPLSAMDATEGVAVVVGAVVVVGVWVDGCA